MGLGLICGIRYTSYKQNCCHAQNYTFIGLTQSHLLYRRMEIVAFIDKCKLDLKKRSTLAVLRERKASSRSSHQNVPVFLTPQLRDDKGHGRTDSIHQSAHGQPWGKCLFIRNLWSYLVCHDFALGLFTRRQICIFVITAALVGPISLVCDHT